MDQINLHPYQFLVGFFIYFYFDILKFKGLAGTVFFKVILSTVVYFFLIYVLVSYRGGSMIGASSYVSIITAADIFLLFFLLLLGMSPLVFRRLQIFKYVGRIWRKS